MQAKQTRPWLLVPGATSLYSERATIVLRWIGILVVLALLNQWQIVPDRGAVYRLLSFAAVYNLIVMTLSGRPRWERVLPALTMLTDGILIVIGMTLTGGVQSDIRYFYFAYPMTVALRTNYAMALISALVAVIGFVGMGLYEGLDAAGLRDTGSFCFFLLFSALASGAYARLIIRSREELEQIVAIRTEELQQANEALRVQTEELAQKKAALEVADRHKDEFISVISHELRTPLNFIMGFASILHDELAGPLNTGQRQNLSRILDGSERMLGLVNDMLDIARIQAGKLHVRPVPTACAPVVDSIVAELLPLAARKDVTLAVEHDTQATVSLDPVRIGQVLTNLIGNAIKFTPDGGAIRVASRLDQAFWCVEVHDSGIGIAAEDLPHLFKRFGQLNMSATREAGGTGLGLAIAKGVIESHRGTIGVDSTPGQGSRFWFRVPLGPDPAAEPPMTAEQTVGP